MANSAYDLVVIGTGPGGYVCAIRAAQLGLKTAVVEKRATHGGTCLNVGCIPSKALPHASELFEEAERSFGKMGINTGAPQLDLAQMMKFKQEGVDGNVKGIDFLFKKNKIDSVHGAGRIVAPGKIEVKNNSGTQTLETKNIVIATGSDVARLKGIDIDEKRVVSSTGALVLGKVPEKLLVVGAGVIGLELGSVWRRLGAQVTVIEFLDRIVPGIDLDVAKSFQRLLEKQGIAFKLSSKVTGVDSSGKRLKGIDIDEKRIVSSDGAIALDRVPQRLLVIGAGVIGLELGSVWRRLGAAVTVVEFLDRILPGIDLEVAKQFQRILQKQGMTFRLASKVTAIDATGNSLKAAVEPAAGGTPESIEADVALVAIGRVPYTEGLGLESAGVTKDNRGRVIVDRHYQTNVPGIYAIGDVIAGPMLAHKAEDEGVAAAEIIAGQAGHVNYDVIPNVVYTFPEIASVGKSEEELKEAGAAYKVGKFPFTANARARVNHTTEGFVKILADAKTDRVLGIHILGPDAGNMIAEPAVAMEFGASSEDIARTCHAHPTLSEAVKEAALAVDKRAIHM